MTHLIELKDVYKIYPMGDETVHALDGVSLSIDQGEFVAIVGSSGSGKSTAMNIIGCLDVPTRGEYLLDGTPIRERTQRELSQIRSRQIAFIFQGYNLIPSLNVWQNVALPMLYQRVPLAERRARAMEALEKVDGCTGAHFHPPVMLLVAYDPEAAWKREDDGKNHGEIDAAIAVTQMMLQAADLGLGTTYVGMFDPEKLHAAFPELAGLTPIALLPMGYPAEGAHPSRLHTDRKPLEELVRYL